jgi:hypothetical protein
MGYFRNIVIAAIFAVAASSATYAQVIDTVSFQDEEVMDYKTFKCLTDRQMSAFLKENNEGNYNIFHRGEMHNDIGRILRISGVVLYSVGSLSLTAGLIMPLFAILTLNSNSWWYINAHWFIYGGLSAMVLGVSLHTAGIILKTYDIGTSKRQDNQTDKFHKMTTTSLNFNLYPNGFGVSLKF